MFAVDVSLIKGSQYYSTTIDCQNAYRLTACQGPTHDWRVYIQADVHIIQSPTNALVVALNFESFLGSLRHLRTFLTSKLEPSDKSYESHIISEGMD